MPSFSLYQYIGFGIAFGWLGFGIVVTVWNSLQPSENARDQEADGPDPYVARPVNSSFHSSGDRL